MSTIRLRRGSGAPTAGSFVEGEPAWDSTGKKLYIKASDGSMAEIGGGAGSTYTFASTAPTSPSAGDTWTDADDGITYQYINDGDSSQWVELGPVGQKGNAGDPGAGVPEGGTTGQVLSKASATDYDTAWTDSAGGSTNLSYDAATRTLASDTGTDATLPLVTSTDAGLVPATGGGTTNFLRADGTFAAPPSSPPGGTSGQLQFNSSGSFGGVASSSVDVDGNVTLRTATVNAPSGYTGNLLDLQVNGTSKARIDSNGSFVGGSNIVAVNTGGLGVLTSGTNPNANRGFLATNYSGLNIVTMAASWRIAWESGPNINTSHVDVVLQRDAAANLALRNGTNAQTYRVYNTYTSSTNYERAKIEWSSNTLRIGTEKGSAGGTARDMELQTDGTTRITVKSDGAILFSGLPTSDPVVANQLWNDGGTLKISAG